MRYAQKCGFVIAFCFFAGTGGTAAYRYLGKSLFSRPQIVCDDHVFDLGRVAGESEFRCRFHVGNRGTRPLLIEDVRVGCGSCLEVVDFPTEPVAPGDLGIVEVAFSTKNLNGKVTRRLLVRSNDPQRPSLVLQVVANIGNDGSNL